MTSDLSNFAARLRETFFLEGRAPDSFAENSAFDSLALELFALEYRQNLPYKKFCQACGCSPETIRHWTGIPAVPTSAFKELELSCLPPGERTTVFHSSGTTQQKPSRHFHNAESLAIYEAALWPWFEAHVVRRRRLGFKDLGLVILTPPSWEVPHSSLVHMFETIRRKLGADESAFVGRIDEGGSWTLDFDAVLTALNSKSEMSDPKLILGTAFSFVHLLDAMAERNLRFVLPAGSRVMETGGYKGRSRVVPKSELHAMITERLGIPSSHIVCEYGMSELSSQAYDLEIQNPKLKTQNSRSFHFPPWARAQIISPETGREVTEGETGLIRVFDLANVWSVMAIQTEDLAARREKGFELIGRAEFAEQRGCSLMAV